MNEKTRQKFKKKSENSEFSQFVSKPDDDFQHAPLIPYPYNLPFWIFSPFRTVFACFHLFFLSDSSKFWFLSNSDFKIPVKLIQK